MGRWGLVIRCCFVFLHLSWSYRLDAYQTSTGDTAITCPGEDPKFTAFRTDPETFLVAWKSSGGPYPVELSIKPRSSLFRNVSDVTPCCRDQTILSNSNSVFFVECCPKKKYEITGILRCAGSERRYDVTVVTGLTSQVTGLPASEPQKMVKVSKQTSGSVRLTWHSFQSLFGGSRSYKIHYWISIHDPSSGEEKITNNTWIVIRKLQPSTEYCFTVSAKLNRWGVLSDAICTLTEEGSPTYGTNPTDPSKSVIDLESVDTTYPINTHAPNDDKTLVDDSNRLDYTLTDDALSFSPSSNRNLLSVTSQSVDTTYGPTGNVFGHNPYSTLGSQAFNPTSSRLSDHKYGGATNSLYDLARRFGFDPNTTLNLKSVTGRDMETYATDSNSQISGYSDSDWETSQSMSEDPAPASTTIIPKPGRVTYVDIFNVTDTSAAVEWSPPEEFGADVNQYRLLVECRDCLKQLTYLTVDQNSALVEGLEPYTKYEVTVFAGTDARWGDGSTAVAFETHIGIPGSPLNLQVHNVTSTSATIQYQPPLITNGPITRYGVYYDNLEGDFDTVVVQESLLILNHLTPFTRYRVKVSAATAAGWGDPTEFQEFQTAIGIPGPPENVTVEDVTNITFAVKWDPPKEPNGPNLTYEVLWMRSNISESLERKHANATRAVVDDLYPFELYAVWITAKTEAGWGPESEIVEVFTDVGVPGPPIHLAAQATNTTITAQWEPPIRSNAPRLAYIVSWNKLDRPNEIFESPIVPDTMYEIFNLSSFKHYQLKVLAQSMVGRGEWSEVVIAKTTAGLPGKPTMVSATNVTNTSAAVSWNPPLEDTGPIVGYKVSWNRVARLAMENETEDTEISIENLLPYTKYEVKLAARSTAGWGPWSDVFSFVTAIGLPGKPTIAAAINITNTSAVVTWNPPLEDTGPIVGYKVSWNRVARLALENETEDTEILIENLLPYTKYEVKLAARSSAGWGPWSDVFSFVTAIGLPGPPQSLKITALTNVTANVSWSRPEKPNGPIEMYKVFWSEASSVGGEAPDGVLSNDMALQIRTLLPFRKYCFWVVAKTAAGWGQSSGAECGQTGIGLPGSPMNAKITDLTNTTATFSWSPPKDPNGPILDYTVFWKFASHYWNRSLVSNGTKLQLSGLQPYEEYCFKVSAKTSAGRGPPSDSVCKQTDIGIPEEPEGFGSDSVSNNSIFLRWSPPKYPRGPILKYSVDVSLNSTFAIAKIETNETVAVATGLLPYTVYILKVTAATSAGWGVSSKEIPVRTDAAIPDGAKIENVKVAGSRSVSVTWRPTSELFPGPTTFRLQVWRRPILCRKGDDEDRMVKEETGSNLWGLNLKTLVGLVPYSRYFFKVLVQTSAGASPFSDASAEVRTEPDVPGLPVDIKADCSLNPTSVRVSWYPPSPPNGAVRTYKITYASKNDVGTAEHSVSTENSCELQSYVLRGLTPEVPYWISVRAKVDHVDDFGSEARVPYCVLPAGIPPVSDATTPTHASGVGLHELQLRWSRKLFSASMGKIAYYAIIVGEADSIGSPTNGSMSELIEPPAWILFENRTSRIYQATPPQWNPFEDSSTDTLKCQRDELISDVLICVLGHDANCSAVQDSGFCNGPLRPATEYGIKLRGFTRGGFSESKAVFAKTASLPGGSSGLIIGMVFMAMCVVALGSAFFVLKRNPRRKEQVMRVFTILRKGTSVQMAMESAPPSAPTRPDGNLVAPFSRQFEFKEFLDHVKMMMSDSYLKFSLEFEELKRQSPRWPCTVAEMEENRPKNRWLNIFPFDHSRVKLLPIDDEPGSDFVNASFIPGYTSQREYIASQGPLPSTVDDFWRMVWEQSVSLVVMLTQCVERGKSKCEQYWPTGTDTRVYGDLKVQMMSESILEAYVIRIFIIQLGSRERKLKQMHFTRWPDFGSPERPGDLINFVRAAREHIPGSDSQKKGPILVHCSAGVGRTGTFIAVDRLMQQMEEQRYLDVYELVLEMRQHRTNMVQTEDQYIYIHKCMREVILAKSKTSTANGVKSDGIYSNVKVKNDTKV